MYLINKNNFYVICLFIINSLIVIFNLDLILLNILFAILIFLHFNKINRVYSYVIFFYFIFKILQFLLVKSIDDFLDVLRFSLIIFLIEFLKNNDSVLKINYLKYLYFLNIVLTVLFSFIFFINFFPNFNESSIDVTLNMIGLSNLNQTSFVFYLIFSLYISYLIYGIRGFNKFYIPLVLILIFISFKIIYILSLIIAFLIVILLSRKKIKFFLNAYVLFFFIGFLFYGNLFADDIFDILTNFRGRIWFSMYDDFNSSNVMTKLFGFGYGYQPISEIPFSLESKFQYTSAHSGYLRYLMINGLIGLIFLFVYLNILTSVIIKKTKVHLFFLSFIIISLVSDGSILYKLNDIPIISLLILIPNSSHSIIFDKNEK